MITINSSWNKIKTACKPLTNEVLFVFCCLSILCNIASGIKFWMTIDNIENQMSYKNKWIMVAMDVMKWCLGQDFSTERGGGAHAKSDAWYLNTSKNKEIHEEKGRIWPFPSCGSPSIMLKKDLWFRLTLLYHIILLSFLSASVP